MAEKNMQEVMEKAQVLIEALPYIQKFNGKKVVVDIENYREKRYKTLESLAKSVANNVRKTRTDYALEPMPSYERKIIHSRLQDSNKVTTNKEQSPYWRPYTILTEPI